MRFWPMRRGHIITSRFRTPERPGHWGTDFGWPGGSAGLPVYAAQGGTMQRRPYDPGGFGHWCTVDHPTADGSGLTVYGHVIPEAPDGARVEAGQRIARINPDRGSNGGVDPHLHFEVHRSVWVPPGPDRLNPEPWLAGAVFPEEGPAPVAQTTVYGIDVSNHQGNFNFAQAKAEGFRFATHKITESNNYTDPHWPRARDEMARHFPGRWGGYVFCRRAAHPGAEAALLARHAGPLDFPLQIDYEDTNGGGSLDDLWARYNAYRDAGFTRFLPVYIPRWFWRDRMGSPNLSDFPLEIWNSHYVTGTGFASALYPGDGHEGWAPVGNKPVAILQFTDTALVAGQRIDANAVRGEQKLAEIFGEGEELDMAAVEHITDFIKGYLDPLISDVKDLREQATGSRDLIRRPDGTIDVEASYPGWTQLGDSEQARRTQTDGLARALRRLESLEKRIADLEGRQ